MRTVSNDTKKIIRKERQPSANPFIKHLQDKEQIAEALKKGEDVSALKDITLAKPL